MSKSIDAEKQSKLEYFRKQIVGTNKEVPLLDGSLQRYINLDNAAGAPCLEPAFDRSNEILDWY